MAHDIQGRTNRTSTSGINVVIFESANFPAFNAAGDRRNEAKEESREGYHSELKKRLESRGHKVELWNSKDYNLASEEGFEKARQISMNCSRSISGMRPQQLLPQLSVDFSPKAKIKARRMKG